VKRFVGITLIVMAYLLCPVWVSAVPESEPEIGAITLIGIIYILAFGIVLSVNSSHTDS
jgi:hypothetical protein